MRVAAMVARVQLTSIALNDKERNGLLLEHAGAIIYTILPDGVMTYVSANWPRVLGHQAEEVVGANFSRFVHPGDHPACFAFLERIVGTGEPESGIEYRVIHADGRLFWHTSSIIPVKDNAGGVIGYVGVAHDITRLKETQAELHDANKHLAALVASREEELRQATKEALTAAESEAGRIGQDIHDSLCQDLVGLSRLAEAATPCNDRSGPSCCAAVSQIRDHAARLAGVARNYSHSLTLHELEVQSLPEALETLARRTNEMLRTETETNISEDLDFLTHEQTVHLYRIIREALANAVKHANAAHIWIDVVREPDRLAVSVSNDGTPLVDAALRHDGLGLRQMRMRASLLGGALDLRDNGRDQTVLELIMPLDLKRKMETTDCRDCTDKKES
ncbi:MAG: PAS domain S-box protein [Verrucomicrobiota bacterium]